MKNQLPAYPGNWRKAITEKREKKGKNKRQKKNPWYISSWFWHTLNCQFKKVYSHVKCEYEQQKLPSQLAIEQTTQYRAAHDISWY